MTDRSFASVLIALAFIQIAFLAALAPSGAGGFAIA